MASTAASDADVNLPGTLDLTDNGPEYIERNNAATENRYDGSLIQQYKFTIVGWIVSFALIIATVALGAISLQQSNEALAQATSNVEAIESENFIIVNGNENEAESIGGGTPSAPKDITPNPTPNPTTPKPTTPKPTTVQPTGVPTEPHPFNPKWFQTTHSKYQSLYGLSTGIHTNTVAASFCVLQDLWLCGYDSYCPNGEGGDAFNGGPPKAHNSETLEQTQWAPFYTGDKTEIAAGKNWVQVGLIPASASGTVENSFGKCSTYDDWYFGEEKDIEDGEWEEKHRMWILCCDKPEEGEETR